VKGKHQFSVKPNRKDSGKPTEVVNQILIKRFTKKWKMSGISQELKDRRAPVTRGMKRRKKKHQGKMRHLRGKRK